MAAMGCSKRFTVCPWCLPPTPRGAASSKPWRGRIRNGERDHPMNAASLEAAVDRLPRGDADASVPGAVRAVRTALSEGVVRAAERTTPPRAAGRSLLGQAGNLLGFKSGRRGGHVGGSRPLAVLRQGHVAREAHRDRRRRARRAWGMTVRDGAYLGQKVICMPPMYINSAAYVGDGRVVDSHALVGSCAQIGTRASTSAPRRQIWRRAGRSARCR